MPQAGTPLSYMSVFKARLQSAHNQSVNLFTCVSLPLNSCLKPHFQLVALLHFKAVLYPDVGSSLSVPVDQAADF